MSPTRCRSVLQKPTRRHRLLLVSANGAYECGEAERAGACGSQVWRERRSAQRGPRGIPRPHAESLRHQPDGHCGDKSVQADRSIAGPIDRSDWTGTAEGEVCAERHCVALIALAAIRQPRQTAACRHRPGLASRAGRQRAPRDNYRDGHRYITFLKRRHSCQRRERIQLLRIVQATGRRWVATLDDEPLRGGASDLTAPRRVYLMSE